MIPFHSSSVPILLAVQGHPLAQTDRTQKEDEVTARNNLLFFYKLKRVSIDRYKCIVLCFLISAAKDSYSYNVTVANAAFWDIYLYLVE